MSVSHFSTQNEETQLTQFCFLPEQRKYQSKKGSANGQGIADSRRRRARCRDLGTAKETPAQLISVQHRMGRARLCRQEGTGDSRGCRCHRPRPRHAEVRPPGTPGHGGTCCPARWGQQRPVHSVPFASVFQKPSPGFAYALISGEGGADNGRTTNK